MGLGFKKKMINREDELSIVEQCELLGLARSSVYYASKSEYTNEDYGIMKEIDRIYTDYPFYGHRRIYHEVLDKGYNIGRDRVLKYMEVMGISPIYPRPKTTIKNKENTIYPYLLKEVRVTRPNQVWSIDITYIPLRQGFCYMVAIIDWYSRSILSYKLSNTLDVQFCIEALSDALDMYGCPEIFNSDQGSQFTSHAFTKILLDREIQISMDSKGRATDNIFIERFWRTLKYEDIYIKNYDSMKEVKLGVKNYMLFYNFKRKHSSLDYKTPWQIYNNILVLNRKVA